MSITSCKNCGKSFEGNYCPQCGQSATIHRINAIYFLHDIPHSIFHVDKGLPYTFIQLMKRPGLTLKQFLEGKRVNHYRPFAYVIILSAIGSLAAHWNGILLQYLQEHRLGTSVHIAENFFVKYQSVFIFIMIPIVSLCTWLIFRKNKFNFWEHVLVNAYLSAQLNVIVVLIQLLVLVNYFVSGSFEYPYIIFLTGFMTVFMVYYSITFVTLMRDNENHKRLRFKLAFMCFVLGTVYSTGMSIAGIIGPISDLSH